MTRKHTEKQSQGFSDPNYDQVAAKLEADREGNMSIPQWLREVANATPAEVGAAARHAASEDADAVTAPIPPNMTDEELGRVIIRNTNASLSNEDDVDALLSELGA